MSAAIPDDVMEIAYQICAVYSPVDASDTPRLVDAIARAILAERDRCARIVQRSGMRYAEQEDKLTALICEDIVESIFYEVTD